MRILVVEDETLVLFTLEAELTRAGFQVVMASDPASARARLDEEGAQLDGLIVDLNLSAEETGFDVARHARAVNPAMAVIYISGNDRSQWEAQGVEDSVFFAKPVLSSVVADALKARMT
ncbi:MAG: response regulator [Brevundimonas sp.]|uniref:response regulator n=1 Tax=Brevundimonas sp. TaxID=1871086 RepID=UPI00391C6F8C